MQFTASHAEALCACEQCCQTDRCGLRSRSGVVVSSARVTRSATVSTVGFRLLGTRPCTAFSVVCTVSVTRLLSCRSHAR